MLTEMSAGMMWAHSCRWGLRHIGITSPNFSWLGPHRIPVNTVIGAPVKVPCCSYCTLMGLVAGFPPDAPQAHCSLQMHGCAHLCIHISHGV